jgi:1-acyl-sn-glycerol-3-phosphate acyltransferase
MSDDPSVPAPEGRSISGSGSLGAARRGTPFTRALANRLLGLFGWRVEGSIPPCPKFVMIVAPHTSNWDFPVGLFSMFAFGLRLTWVGKHTIFRWPAGPILRWFGGEPIDRTAPGGFVEQVVEQFRTRPQLGLALSPEGTRRPAPEWKTGFHRIALAAGVPIVPVWIDWRTRALRLGEPSMPTDDVAADLTRYRRMFSSAMARFPEKFVEEPPGA